MADHIKNVDIVIDGDEPLLTPMKEAVRRAMEYVITDHSFVNIVKVHMGEVRADQASIVLKELQKLFSVAGADNVVIVPISSYIRDVTVERIEVERK
jgi:hypothetical protein